MASARTAKVEKSKATRINEHHLRCLIMADWVLGMIDDDEFSKDTDGDLLGGWLLNAKAGIQGIITLRSLK